MLTLRSLGDLQSYLSGVKLRANHHAPTVTDVLNHLLAAVLRYADRDSLHCRTWRGHPTNVLRFTLADTPFALRYNHRGVIEVRTPNEYGQVLGTFNNETNRLDTESFIAHLANADLTQV